MEKKKLTEKESQQLVPSAEGHRKRLKDKLIQNGGIGFEDYELLELMLTYAIPRKDVKPLAKNLIARFGSLGNVLCAQTEELKKIKGVKENTIALFKVIQNANLRILKHEILDKNVLKQYTDSGNPSSELEIKISNPVYSSNNRFLCMGEENGQKLYLISGGNILWQNDVEGQISKVNVNKNGYVSVIVTGTSYKAIVVTYNQAGKELFKSYLSSTSAIATDISSDNKYLAIAEVDTSGIVINSNVKIISIEKATTDPTNSVVQIYNSDTNQLISNIKYQDKGSLVCMYDDHISVIENEENKEMLKTEDNVTFMDIRLKNEVVRTREKNSGLFHNNMEIVITNIQNGNESIYLVERAIKSINVTQSKIAVNLGSEVHFLNSNGWLVKKYVSNHEVNRIVVGDSIAGIVYRNKIDIVNI